MKDVEETVFHLFFSCLFSQACWQHLGINWDFTMDFFRMMQQAKVQHNNPFFYGDLHHCHLADLEAEKQLYIRGRPYFDSWKSSFYKEVRL